AKRGTKLTRHLLSFSQKRSIEVEPINANDIISSMGDILSRTLGGMIGVSTRLAKALWATEADAGQLELALFNLAINARDAMPAGGDLTITTENVPGIDGADMVRIAVQDSGVGMTPEIIEHVFDPFFTTKGPGEGSGLGLPQVKEMADTLGGT